MILASTVKVLLRRVGITPTSEEQPVYEFLGRFNGKPSLIILTSKRLIIVKGAIMYPGIPPLRIFDRYSVEILEEKRSSNLAKMVIKSGRKRFSIVSMEHYVNVLKKALSKTIDATP